MSQSRNCIIHWKFWLYTCHKQIYFEVFRFSIDQTIKVQLHFLEKWEKIICIMASVLHSITLCMYNCIIKKVNNFFNNCSPKLRDCVMSVLDVANSLTAKSIQFEYMHVMHGHWSYTLYSLIIIVLYLFSLVA